MQQSHAFTKQKTIKMYATPGCGDCRMAKRWFDSHGIPYEYINSVEDERAAAYVVRLNRDMRSVPTMVLGVSPRRINCPRTGSKMLA